MKHGGGEDPGLSRRSAVRGFCASPRCSAAPPLPVSPAQRKKPRRLCGAQSPEPVGPWGRMLTRAAADEGDGHSQACPGRDLKLPATSTAGLHAEEGQGQDAHRLHTASRLSGGQSGRAEVGRAGRSFRAPFGPTSLCPKSPAALWELDEGPQAALPFLETQGLLLGGQTLLLTVAPLQEPGKA